MDRNLTIVMRRRRAVLAVAVLVVALVAGPTVAVWASHNFTDVPTSSTHHSNIGLVANAGVTQGCQASPPEYCPSDPVTRAQMATFLARLGGLGSHPPVVDAATLDGVAKQNYVFGPDPDTTLVDRSTAFSLGGGSSSECEPTMAFTGQTNFRVQHQLHATPPGIAPWEVNVQIANVAPPNYEVCFATLDGSALPGGTYETYAIMLVYP